MRKAFVTLYITWYVQTGNKPTVVLNKISVQLALAFLCSYNHIFHGYVKHTSESFNQSLCSEKTDSNISTSSVTSYTSATSNESADETKTMDL